MTHKVAVSAAGLVTVATLAGVLYSYSKHADRNLGESSAGFRVAVLPFAGDSEQELTTAVVASLREDVELLVTSLEDSTGRATMDHIASRPDVNASVAGERLHAGRFEGVNVFLLQGGRQHHVFSAGRPHVSFRQYRGRMAHDIARAVKARLDITSELRAASVAGPDALRDYLTGRSHLDEPRSPGSLQGAAAHFDSALRQAPDYAAAHAGLCDTFIEQALLEGETRRLDVAERQCVRALELAPNATEVLIANGNLLRERGKLDEALLAFDKALKRDAYYPHAYLGLAKAHLAAHRRTGAPEALHQALQRASQAAELDAQMWQAPYLIGLIYAASGNSEAAIEAMETAKTLDANAQVLSRLAALYACSGDQRRATAMYERARERSPEIIAGQETAGADCPAQDAVE